MKWTEWKRLNRAAWYYIIPLHISWSDGGSSELRQTLDPPGVCRKGWSRGSLGLGNQILTCRHRHLLQSDWQRDRKEEDKKRQGMGRRMHAQWVVCQQHHADTAILVLLHSLLSSPLLPALTHPPAFFTNSLCTVHMHDNRFLAPLKQQLFALSVWDRISCWMCRCAGKKGTVA